TTVTATRTGGGVVGLQVFEYRGLALATPVDRTATGTSGTKLSRSNGAFTCGTVTTTQANELLISGVANNTGPGTNVNNAWTRSFTDLYDTHDSTNKLLLASAARTVAATASYSTGSVLQGGSGSGVTRCVTATFRASF